MAPITMDNSINMSITTLTLRPVMGIWVVRAGPRVRVLMDMKIVLAMVKVWRL